MRATTLALTVMLAVAPLAACKRKPPAPPAPPPTPLTFAQATPDATVRLAIAPAIAAWPALHQKLFNDGTAELKKDLETAKDDRGHIAGEGLPNPAYEHELTWSVAARTPRLVSLKGTWMSYTGGAHPNSGFRTLLWDTNSASGPIDRSELLAPPGAGDATVQAALCDAIHQARIAKGVGPDEDPSMWPCPKWRDSDFVLERSGVPGKFGGFTFVFDPYSIGSYAEGPYEVTVHYTVIKNVLAPTYANEFSGGPVHPPRPGELAQTPPAKG
jgi:hypothetical protein